MLTRHFIISKISEIEEFLLPYSKLWQYEPLSFHPQIYPKEILELIQSIKSSSLDFKLEITNQKLNKDFSPQLQALINKINELSALPLIKLGSNIQLDRHKKLKQKKSHEISRLINFLKDRNLIGLNYLDFAGGVGHLSFAVTNYLKGKSTCIEKNSDLIKSGHSLFGNEEITYQNSDIYELKSSEFQNHDHAFSLHCCGDLTDKILSIYKENQDLKTYTGFGCCYHKVPDEFKLTNIHLTNEAKTLAMRSHKTHSREDLEKRIQVKNYRYSLELFLKNPLNLRSSVPDAYRADYKNYLEHQTLPKDFNTKKAIDHFNDSETLETVNFLINAGLMRGLFGRLIEVYINLSRVVRYSKEKDQIFIGELFDSEISQRNILIFIMKDEKHPPSLDLEGSFFDQFPDD